MSCVIPLIYFQPFVHSEYKIKCDRLRYDLVLNKGSQITPAHRCVSSLWLCDSQPLRLPTPDLCDGALGGGLSEQWRFQSADDSVMGLPVSLWWFLSCTHIYPVLISCHMIFLSTLICQERDSSHERTSLEVGGWSIAVWF